MLLTVSSMYRVNHRAHCVVSLVVYSNSTLSKFRISCPIRNTKCVHPKSSILQIRQSGKQQIMSATNEIQEHSLLIQEEHRFERIRLIGTSKQLTSTDVN